MTINIETAIRWMTDRVGRVTYSMDFRNGPNSFDCSSSVYYALMSAGAISAGWAVNTEYEHDWLVKTVIHSLLKILTGMPSVGISSSGAVVDSLLVLVAILVSL